MWESYNYSLIFRHQHLLTATTLALWAISVWQLIDAQTDQIRSFILWLCFDSKLLKYCLWVGSDSVAESPGWRFHYFWAERVINVQRGLTSRVIRVEHSHWYSAVSTSTSSTDHLHGNHNKSLRTETVRPDNRQISNYGWFGWYYYYLPALTVFYCGHIVLWTYFFYCTN